MKLMYSPGYHHNGFVATQFFSTQLVCTISDKHIHRYRVQMYQERY